MNRLHTVLTADVSGWTSPIRNAQYELNKLATSQRNSAAVMKNWDASAQFSTQSINGLGRALGGTANAAGRYVTTIGNASGASSRFGSSTRTASNALSGLDNQINLTRTLLQSLGFMFASLFTVNTFIQGTRLISTYQSMANQLKAVTDATFDAAGAQERLLQIAQRSRTDVQGTTLVFTRFIAVQKQLGASTEELYRVTEGVSKAITLSGATPQAAQAALVQLGQALGAGVLRGEELNSVLEQTRALGYAIADGLGVSVGQLRRMGAEGKLTASAVFAALQRSAGDVEDSFGRTTATIGESLGLVTNAITIKLGRMAEDSKFNEKFANSMKSLADNMEGVLSTGLALGGAAVTVAYGKLANGLVQLTAAKMAASRASVDEANRNILVANTSIAAANANRIEAAQKLSAAQQAVIKARADIQGATSASAYTAATKALTVAVAQEATAHKVATAAALNHTAAISTNAPIVAANAAKTGMLAKATGALGGAMAVVGGPVGFATLAATGLAMYASSIDEATVKAKEHISAAEKLALTLQLGWRTATGSQDEYLAKQEAMAEGSKRTSSDLLADIEKKQAQIEKMNAMMANGAADMPSASVDNMVVDTANVKILQGEVDKLTDAIEYASKVRPYDAFMGKFNQELAITNQFNRSVAELYGKTSDVTERLIGYKELQIKKDEELAKLALENHVTSKSFLKLSEQTQAINIAEYKYKNKIKALEEKRIKDNEILNATTKDQSELAAGMAALSKRELEDRKDLAEERDNELAAAKLLVSSTEKLLGKYDEIQEIQNTYKDDLKDILDLQDDELVKADLRAKAEKKKSDAMKDYLDDLKKEAREMDSIADRFDKLGGDTGAVDMDKIMGKAADETKQASKGFEKMAAELVRQIKSGNITPRGLGASITRLENYAKTLGLESAKWDTQGMVNAAQEIAKFANEQFAEGNDQPFTAMDYAKQFQQTIDDRKRKESEEADRRKWLTGEIERVSKALDSASTKVENAAKEKMVGELTIHFKHPDGSNDSRTVTMKNGKWTGDSLERNINKAATAVAY